MKKKLLAVLLAVTVIFLCGCESTYSESDLEEAKRQAYNEGYDDGYYRGVEDQREVDCEQFLLDGQSIRDVEAEVYNEYGMTPSEAFTIIDEYEYDSTHGGYTKAEYQYAIEVAIFTACVFPYNY